MVSGDGRNIINLLLFSSCSSSSTRPVVVDLLCEQKENEHQTEGGEGEEKN